MLLGMSTSWEYQATGARFGVHIYSARTFARCARKRGNQLKEPVTQHPAGLKLFTVRFRVLLQRSPHMLQPVLVALCPAI